MLGDAIGFAITRFEDSEASQRVLILLTDGNDTGSKMPPRKAAGIAARHEITIHTVSVGDPEAAGETKLDVEVLRDIASSTNGSYFHADDRAALDDVYRELDALEASTFETESYRPKTPLFPWPLGLAVFLLALYHGILAVLAARAGRRTLDA
jgi:Ca-activated chloride channel family protein